MKAVFLDRDGTLIVDPPDERVKSVEEIQLFPDTLRSLRKLANLDYGVFIATNQAGIGERLISEREFRKINSRVLEILKPTGIKILNTYFCPHAAEDNCKCRKPKPTMLLRAAKDFSIDLANSYMVGDHESDILAGVNAGTKTILVQTGNTLTVSPEATYTAPHLLDAIRYIANRQSQ